MEVVITNDAKEVLLREEFQTLADRPPGTAIEEKTERDTSDYWDTQVTEFSFDGIHMMHASAHVHDTLHIRTFDTNAMVGSFFLQQGDLKTTVDGITKGMRFSTLEHNLMYNPQAAELTEIRRQKDMAVFSLSFTRERFLQLAENNGPMLDQLADNVAGNKPAILDLRKNLVLTPRIQQVIAEVKGCSFQGGIKKLFLQSKAMELLALQCQQYEMNKGQRVFRYQPSPADMLKIRMARDILLQDLHDIPNLQTLSRKTGLNEFKLKAGFKAVFGTTVFGYLNDYRLEQARLQITGSRLPLGDIAFDAGYSSLSHFSNAFRRKFGSSPGKLRKG